MRHFYDILEQRRNLATLCGIITQANDGRNVEQAPCNMPLGDAILQLVAADEQGLDTRGAIVVWRSGILDRQKCLDIAERFGVRLASNPEHC